MSTTDRNAEIVARLVRMGLPTATAETVARNTADEWVLPEQPAPAPEPSEPDMVIARQLARLYRSSGSFSPVLATIAAFTGRTADMSDAHADLLVWSEETFGDRHAAYNGFRYLSRSEERHPVEIDAVARFILGRFFPDGITGR